MSSGLDAVTFDVVIAVKLTVEALFESITGEVVFTTFIISEFTCGHVIIFGNVEVK